MHLDQQAIRRFEALRLRACVVEDSLRSMTADRAIQLVPRDAERYTRIRSRMLLGAPWAFAASPEDDPSLDCAHLSQALQDERLAIFAVPVQTDSPQEATTDQLPELIATCGIRRMKGSKLAHRAKLWGVWVDPPYRGRGLGRAVVASALQRARRWSGVDYVDLGVSENAPEALRLYEGLGFEAWGREPASIQDGAQRYDEIYMSLRL